MEMEKALNKMKHGVQITEPLINAETLNGMSTF